MNVYLNLWGGEGYLTAASMLALASVGIYDDIVDSSDNAPVKIIYGCYDFTGPANGDKARCDAMFSAYEKYYCKIIRDSAPAVTTSTTIINNMVNGAAPMKLKNKYAASREMLAFGCNRADMDTDLAQGIYGKPWVGEAYYADSVFDSIYAGAENDIVIINCGGYKGGGTAATFIPLENRYIPVGINPPERFNIIVGPSTQFDRLVKYPNPGIYKSPVYDRGVDLFNIPDAIEELHNMVRNQADQTRHDANVAYLQNEYKQVFDPDAHGGPIDRRSLDPINYMTRFVDRVESDSTMKNVKASFINLKPNLSVDQDGNFNYDVTSPKFLPDQQTHRLHITNMLSAVEVQEIAMNHRASGYAGGKIYVFQNPDSNQFTLDGVFRPEDVKKILHFVIFSMLITDYAFNCFNDISLPGVAVLLDKWALTKGWNHSVVLDEKKAEGALNIMFATVAKRMLTELAHEFIKPTLLALLDIDDTCPDVSFFSKAPIGNADHFRNGVYGIVRGIVDKIRVTERGEKYILAMKDATVIKENADSSTAALIMNRFDQPNDYGTCLNYVKSMQNMGFLNYYQNMFPQFGEVSGMPKNRHWKREVNINNVETYAREYCNQIIKITYDTVRNNFN